MHVLSLYSLLPSALRTVPIGSVKKGRLDTACVYPQLCLGALVSLFPDDVSYRVGLTASRRSSYEQLWNCEDLRWVEWNKKAQLSLTNPRATRNHAKNCSNRRIDVLTTFSLTILVYLHSFSCCWVRNLRNPEKFSEISNLLSSRSSKVIDLGVNRKRICNFLLVMNSNFGRISYSFRDIDTFSCNIACSAHPTIVWRRLAEERLALST